MNSLTRKAIYTDENIYLDPLEYQPLDVWIKYEGGLKAHIYYRTEQGTWGEMLG